MGAAQAANVRAASAVIAYKALTNNKEFAYKALLKKEFAYKALTNNQSLHIKTN